MKATIPHVKGLLNRPDDASEGSAKAPAWARVMRQWTNCLVYDFLPYRTVAVEASLGDEIPSGRRGNTADE
jgi:hypothetical protein